MSLVIMKSKLIDHAHRYVPYVYLFWKFDEDRSCRFWHNGLKQKKLSYRRGTTQCTLCQLKSCQLLHSCMKITL